MRDERKTKKQLITEIAELRRKLWEMDSAKKTKTTGNPPEQDPKIFHQYNDERLHLSNEKLIKAFHANPNSMTITTFSEGRFIEVNDSFLRMVGRRREELIGKTVKELGTSMKPTRTKLKNLLEKQGTIRGLEVQFQKRSGEIKIGRLTSELIQLNGEKCILIMIEDITEYKKTENEIARLERLGDIPKLMANEKEIRQLIINLVRNGLEAMHPKGTLNIGTCYQDNEVWLFVEDEGTGIQSEILDKLGTPFVTTKDTGTGLGLAVCYSIANRHNAKIDVATSPKGTTFVVRFALPVTQVTSVDELVACSSEQ